MYNVPVIISLISSTTMFLQRFSDNFNRNKDIPFPFFFCGLDTIPAVVTWKRFVVLSFVLLQFIYLLIIFIILIYLFNK